MFSLPKFVKKLTLSLLTALVLVFNTAAPVQAAGTWYNQTFFEWADKVYGGNETAIFGERYTAAQVQWVIYGLAGFIVNIPGPFITDFFRCTGSTTEILVCAVEVLKVAGFADQSTQQPEKKQQTLVQAVFEERPISFITYTKDIGRNLKIIPEANAQSTQAGIGFSALNPILDLWKAARNICYALLVIVIIALSFMIMFKVKISPQASITVQSAIPKIIIALLLITFSYAIAGLLIDLMYVVIGIISLGLATFFNGNPVTAFNLLTKGQPFGGDVNLGIWGMFVAYLIFFVITLVVTIIVSLGVFGTIVVGGAGAIIATALGIGSGGILPTIAVLALIVVIIMLIVMVLKTVWALLKALAGTLLLTIAAPFQILLGTVVPGMGFGSWLRSFIANLATFVTIGLLFQLSFLFLVAAWGALFPGDIWKAASQLFFGTDPIIHPGEITERAWPPLLGSGDGAVPMIFLGVSFVLFTIIPKSAEVIQAFIKGQQFNYGAALNETIFNPATMGFLGSQSSAQQGRYEAERKRVAETRGATFDTAIQRAQDAWSAIRGMSGGRIK